MDKNVDFGCSAILGIERLVSRMQWEFACRPCSFLLSLLACTCFSLVSGTVSLTFLDAPYPSGVWLPWDGCGYCGAIAALEPAGQPLWLLSEFIDTFALGGKSRRTCAPTRFGSSPAVHQHTMATTAFFSGRSVAGAETGLPND